MTLQDVDAWLDALGRWATDHPVIGFAVMGWLGGVVAVLRMYERAGIVFTAAGFLGRCLMKGLIGVFVAALVFFAWRGAKLSLDWGYLAAAVCGVWGTEVLEVMFVVGIEYVRKKLGLSSAPVYKPPRCDEPG